MSSSRPLLSIVAPVYNEAPTLPELLSRIIKATGSLEGRYSFEFVFVDDGSTDTSLDVAKQLTLSEPRLRVIELRRNFGQTAALQAGLSAAKGELVLSMDADLQHFPEDIPDFVAKIEQGYDLVCGWRHERQEGIIRRWPSYVANRIIKRVSGLDLHDFGTTFRAYRADLLQHLTLLGEQHRFVPALAMLVGARITEIKIRNIERPIGKSNYGIGRTLNVMLDILFLYFTTHYLDRLLKAFGRIAIWMMLGGSAIAAWLLTYAWLTGVATVRVHSGWFLFSILLFLSSLQVMLVGLLAEVLVRIYYSNTGSERYVVRKEWRRDGDRGWAT